jgi:hypothetical protein
VILQNTKRNGPVGAYFTFETTEVPILAFGDVQVSDVGNAYGSSFCHQIGMSLCIMHIQNLLKYQNLPLEIIQNVDA